jgi:hypothetical protein
MTTWGSQLEPGDLILVRDRGLPRRGGGCDRIGVVVAVGGIVVEEPTTGRVQVAHALRNVVAPLVLRPSWPSRAARESFLGWFEGVAERRAQTWRTPRLVFRLMLKHSLRAAMPLERVPIDRGSWAASRAVFLTLDRLGRELVEAASGAAPRRPQPPTLPPGGPEPTSSALSLS